ncbi:MAG TPA: hypothetical protein VKB17_03895 [Thermoleophilaceae bacterium]|nr:hypothetical protein [Thermoleophilaceae bacterium]
MVVIAYVLFLVAGFGFGYAAPGKWKFVPLLFPLVLAAGAFVRDGVDVASLIRLVVAIVVTLIGIVLGAVLGERSASGEAAGAT